MSLDVVPRGRIIVTIVCEESFLDFSFLFVIFLNFKFSCSFVRGACDILVYRKKGFEINLRVVQENVIYILHSRLEGKWLRKGIFFKGKNPK